MFQRTALAHVSMGYAPKIMYATRVSVTWRKAHPTKCDPIWLMNFLAYEQH